MTSYSSQFDPINPRAPFIWHGGDYNPEQWPPETWDTDMELMRQSHFNVATVGVFSWVSLQPEEDRFTFEWLDTILDKQSWADQHLLGRAAAEPGEPVRRVSVARICGSVGAR
jgi:beta-galactosidase